ncbi:hypothetical protein [Latilactobacillus fragifolii]|uniref:hypothetical protein n=1 Tax=Latilactobacillus fragifolii TaxID=2814244 RepID=UPI001ABA7ED4|nr:hypothetical protein [Latilactobacillus fragifolii]
MSWKTQQTPQQLFNQAILALIQQYAELAYQDMTEKFDAVSQQLKTTETALKQCQQQNEETARQFAALRAENEVQKQNIQTFEAWYATQPRRFE